MTDASASASGTGPSLIFARRTSSGMRESRVSFPLGVSLIILTPSTLAMSARPFLFSHPTASFPMPSGIEASISGMGISPPFLPMTVIATLSGRPSETAFGSART